MTRQKSIFRMLKGIGIVFALLILLLIAVFVYQTQRPVRFDTLTLMNLSDQQVSLDSLLAGKHTVFNFWATWCKPCIEEMPMLDSVHQSLDKEKWQILLISEEPVEKIKAFQSKKELTLPFLRSGTPLSELSITALPKTVIVDERRNVLYTKTGGLTMGMKEFMEVLERYE